MRAEERIRPVLSGRIFPLFLCGFLLLPSLYWILRDESVWRWDPSWYGQVSIDLWHTLIHEPRRWPAAMMEAFGSKAPGLAWFGQFFVPIGQLTGSIETALLLFILMLQLGTLLLLWEVTRAIVPDKPFVSCAVVIFAAGAPLFIGLTHVYVVEALQLFGVTYFYWLAAKATACNRVSLAAHLVIAASLALLAKASSPLYCAAPGLLVVFYLAQARRTESADRRGFIRQLIFLFVATILFAGTTAWYWRNFGTIKNFVQFASSGEAALYYGSKAAFSQKLLYWLSTAQRAFLRPEVAVFLAVATAIATFKRFQQREVQFLPNHVRWLTIAALVEIGCVLIIFALNVNESPHYLLPLLPALAIVLAMVCSLVASRAARMLIAVLVLVQWSIASTRPLGWAEIDASIADGGRNFSSNRVEKRELQRLVQLTATEATQYKYNIVGIELPWLNANTLAFEAARQRLTNHLRCHFTSLGYAAKDEEAAWRRLNDFHPPFFISIEADRHRRPPRFFNRVALPVLQRVQQDGHFVREPFESERWIVVFRNSAEAMPPPVNAGANSLTR